MLPPKLEKLGPSKWHFLHLGSSFKLQVKGNRAASNKNGLQARALLL